MRGATLSALLLLLLATAACAALLPASRMRTPSLHVGATHMCLLDGTLRCWGQGSVGELGGVTGPGSIDTRAGVAAAPRARYTFGLGVEPVVVAAAALGTTFTCALSLLGAIVCHGGGASGQLGSDSSGDLGTGGSPVSTLSPIVFSASETAIGLAAGADHACALFSRGRVRCWGGNSFGQLGIPAAGSIGNSPGDMSNLAALPLPVRADAIYAGSGSTCVLAQGTVRCWGRNDFGQLGRGSTANYGGGAGEISTLGAIAFGVTHPVVDVSMVGHVCATFADGSLRCWGHNNKGQLGQGGVVNIGTGSGLTMAQLAAVDLGTTVDVESAATGASFTCALFRNGRVRCWGMSAHGALGNDSTDAIGDGVGLDVSDVPDIVFGTTLEAIQIAANAQTACALFANFQPICWGRNAEGLLAHDDTASIGDDTGEMSSLDFIPIVGNVGGRTMSNMYQNHACMFENNQIRCWGNGGVSASKLGLATTVNIGDNSNEMSALAPLPFTEPVMQIDAGFETTCILSSLGNVRCIGEGDLGIRGDGTLADVHDLTLAPVLAFTDSTRVVYISLGKTHGCAVFRAGYLKCWGHGDAGALFRDSAAEVGDDPGEIEALVPVTIGATVAAIKVDSGEQQNCVLFINGRISCFGLSSEGQNLRDMGAAFGNDPGEVSSPSPVFITFSTSDRAVDLATSRKHSCAIFANGKIRCWGFWNAGATGQEDNTSIGNSLGDAIACSFLNFSTSHAAVQVTAGDAHTCALFESLRGDNFLRCWGEAESIGSGATEDLGDQSGEMSMLADIPLGDAYFAKRIVAGDGSTCAEIVTNEIICFGVAPDGVLGQGNTVSATVPNAIANLPAIDFPSAPLEPTTVSCGSITSTSFNVGWTAPTSNGVSVTGYEVSYGMSHPFTSALTGSTSELVTDLLIGQTYLVRVRATNSKTAGPWSDGVMCTTTPGPPLVPTSFVCSAFTSSAITVTWSAPEQDGGAPVTDYDLFFDGAVAPVGTSGTSQMTGLSSGTSFDLKLRASNTYGDGPYTSTITCTTFDVPGAPALPTCASITDTGMVVNWAEPNDFGDPITGYDLIFGGTPYSLGDVLFSTRTGLTMTTSYNVLVRARNGVGPGSYSATQVCYTSSSAPAPPVPACSYQATDEVRWSWTDPATNGAPITQYDVERDGTVILAQTSPFAETGANPFETFNLRVRAINSAGDSGWSSTESCSTTGGPPDQPVAPACSDATDTTLTLSLVLPNDNGSPVTSWEIKVGSTPWVTYSVPGAVVLTGLTTNIEYSIVAMAVNADGPSIASSPGLCSTHGVPDSPSNLQCDAALATQISWSWTPGSTNGASITGYTVFKDGISPQSNSGGPSSATDVMTLLSPGTTYSLSVRATNSYGNGPTSVPVLCATANATASELVFATPPTGNVLYNFLIGSFDVEIHDDNGDVIVTGPHAELDVALFIVRVSGNALLGGETMVTAENGVASFSLTSVNGDGGVYAIKASVLDGSLNATSTTFTVFERASILAFATQPVHDDISGAQFVSPPDPVVHILDSTSNLIVDGPHSTLSVTISPGNATQLSLSGSMSTTAIGGVATFAGLSATLLSSVTSQTMLAETLSPSLVTESNTFTVFQEASNLIVLQEPMGDVLAGDDLAASPIVQVVDVFGQNVEAGPHAVLTLDVALAGGPGTLSGASSGVAVAGMTSFGLLSIDTPGTFSFSVTCSSPGLTASTGTFTVFGFATALYFYIQPDPLDVMTDMDLFAMPWIEIRDVFGNRITLGPHASLDVAISVNSGPGNLIGGTMTETASLGLADTFSGFQFDTRGTYVLEASTTTPTLTELSNPFTIFPRAEELQFQVVPIANVSTYQNFFQMPTVKILDGNGDVCDQGPHSTLTITLTAMPGSVVAGSTALSSLGVASFSGVQLSRGGSITVGAGVPSPSLVTNVGEIVFVHGAMDNIAWCTQPIGGIVPGDELAQSPAVCIRDEFDSTIEFGTDSQLSVSIALQGGDPRATLDGATVVSAVGGLAAFPGLSVSWNGTYQLSATVGAEVESSLAFVIETQDNQPPQVSMPANVTTSEDVSAPIFANLTDPDLYRGFDTFHVVLNRTFVSNPLAPLGSSEPCLSLGGSGSGLTFALGSASACEPVHDFFGLAADVNVALNGLVLTTGTNWHGTVDVHLLADDMGNTGIGGTMFANGTAAVVVTPVNDAPLVLSASVDAWVVACSAVVEDEVLLLPPLVIVDPDSPFNTSRLSLHLSSDDDSVLIVLDWLGVPQTPATNHTFPVATVAEVLVALETVTIQGTPDTNGPHNISLVVQDLGDFGTGSSQSLSLSFAVHIAAVNDAPTWEVQGFGPGFNTTWNATLAFDEHLSLDVMTRLMDVDAVESIGNLFFRIWSDGNVAIELLNEPLAENGADAPIEATLSWDEVIDAVAHLRLTSIGGFSGNDMLHLFVEDLGSTGEGGAKNISLDIPISVHPVATILSSEIRSGAWGSRIEIVGNDFGDSDAALIEVFVDSTPCTSVVRLSSSRVSCIASPGSGANHRLHLSVDGKVASNSGVAIVSYAAPVDVRVGNTQTRIVNTGNFSLPGWLFVNTTEPVARVRVTATNGAIFSLAPTIVLSQAPGAPATEYSGELFFRPSTSAVGTSTLSISVEFGGTWALATPSVSAQVKVIPYPAPLISSFSPPTVPPCGGTVTILGNYFGPRAANVSSVRVGTQPCSSVQFVSASALTCTSPVDMASDGRIAVETDSGLAITDSNWTIAARPVVLAVQPVSVPANVATRILVTGTGLGVDASDVRSVTFEQTLADVVDSVPCTDVTFLNDTSLTCLTPAGASTASSRQVVVSTASGCSSGADGPQLDFLGPVVSSVSEATGSIFDPLTLTLTGSGFVGGDIHVAVGSRNCSDVVVVSDTEAVCTVAPIPRDAPEDVVAQLVAENAVVVVTTGDGGSSPVDADVAIAFEVEYRHPGLALPPPRFDNVQPSRGPIGGGYEITLLGSSFGVNTSDLVSVSVGDVPCSSFSYASSRELTCIVGDVTSIASASISGATRTGGTGVGPVQFEFHPLLPDPVDCAPRVGLPGGGDRVSIFGAHLGFAQRETTTPVVTIGGKPCTQVLVSEDHVSCLSPPGDAGDIPLVVVSVDGEANAPIDLRFRYTELVCVPACGRYGNCEQGQCTCFGGYADETCGTNNIELLAPDVLTTSEDDRSDKEILFARVAFAPQGVVKFDLAVSRPEEAAVTPSQITVSKAGNRAIKLRGLGDEWRDGPVPFTVTLSLASTQDPRFEGMLPRVVHLVNLDAKPKIDEVEPSVSALNGTLVTISGRHFDPDAQVFVNDVLVPASRILARSGPQRPGEAETPALARLRQTSSAASQISVALPPADEGDATIKIINSDGQADFDANLFYTDDCPFAGMYGIGNDCRECPEGGECPGGNRIWPKPGYWSPGEDTGVVIECDPPGRCAGTASSNGDGEMCSDGYEGVMCGTCADGYYGAGKSCRPCPASESIMMLIIGDFVVWVLIGVACAAIESKTNVGHILSVVLAIQLAGAVGEQIHHLLPSWILAVYEVLYLFSGDINFVKPDCQGRVDITQTMLISYVYNAMIGLPMHVILGLSRLLSWIRNRDDPDFYERRKAHFVDRHFRALCIHAVIVYLNVCWSTLEFLHCRKLFDDKIRLVIDASIICFEGKHTFVAVVSIFVLLAIGAGLPLAFFLLQRHVTEPALFDTRIQDRWDLMLEPLRRGWRYFWLSEFAAAFTIAFSSTVLQGQGILYVTMNAIVATGIIVLVLWKRCFDASWENFANAGVHVSNMLAVGTAFASGEGLLNDLQTKILVYTCVFVVTVVIVFTTGVGVYNVFVVQTDREIKLAGPINEADLRMDKEVVDDDLFATFDLDFELEEAAFVDSFTRHNKLAERHGVPVGGSAAGGLSLHRGSPRAADAVPPLDFADANELEPGSMWDDLMRTWSGVLPVGMMEEEESESDQVGAGAA